MPRKAAAKPDALLVKQRIDAWELKDALDGAKIPAPVRRAISAPFADAKAAEAALAAFRAVMPTGGDDKLIVDALQEIIKDFKWAKTTKGKLILECNRLVPGLYKKLRQRGIEGVMIGAHSESIAVMVAGKVDSEVERTEALEIVRKAFTVPVLDRLIVK